MKEEILKSQEKMKSIEEELSEYKSEEDKLILKMYKLIEMIQNERFSEKYLPWIQGFILIFLSGFALATARTEAIVIAAISLVFGSFVVINQTYERRKIKEKNQNNPYYTEFKKKSQKKRKENYKTMKNQRNSLETTIDNLKKKLISERINLKELRNKELASEQTYLKKSSDKDFNDSIAKLFEMAEQDRKEKQEIKEAFEEEFLNYLNEEEKNRFYPAEETEIQKVKIKIQNV